MNKQLYYLEDGTGNWARKYLVECKDLHRPRDHCVLLKYDICKRDNILYTKILTCINLTF